MKGLPVPRHPEPTGLSVKTLLTPLHFPDWKIEIGSWQESAGKRRFFSELLSLANNSISVKHKKCAPIEQENFVK